MTMTRFFRPLVTAGAFAFITAALPASATVIGFEDFINPGCCTFIPSGYQGFTWSGGSGSNSWVVNVKDTASQT